MNGGAEAWASEERGRQRWGREDRRKGGLIKLHKETETKQLTAVSVVQISLNIRITMISKQSGKKKSLG